MERSIATAPRPTPAGARARTRICQPRRPLEPRARSSLDRSGVRAGRAGRLCLLQCRRGTTATTTSCGRRRRSCTATWRSRTRSDLGRYGNEYFQDVMPLDRAQVWRTSDPGLPAAVPAAAGDHPAAVRGDLGSRDGHGARLRDRRRDQRRAGVADDHPADGSTRRRVPGHGVLRLRHRGVVRGDAGQHLVLRPRRRDDVPAAGDHVAWTRSAKEAGAALIGPAGADGAEQAAASAEPPTVRALLASVRGGRWRSPARSERSSTGASSSLGCCSGWPARHG